MGNATEVNPEKLQQEFGEILIEGETIEAAYRIIRDKWIFTDKRLIMLDIQGVTGSKRKYHSIPYHNISHFSIETAGTIDDDCELRIWVYGLPTPLRKDFKRGIDIKGLQRTLAKHILK